jgi:butyrate kinase
MTVIMAKRLSADVRKSTSEEVERILAEMKAGSSVGVYDKNGRVIGGIMPVQ